MSLKKFSQTRWNIEPQRVTLYPYRLLNLMGVVLGIIFLIFGLIAAAILHVNPIEGVHFNGSVITFIVLIVFLLWAAGRTHVVFDNHAQMMRKKVFGIITTRSEPFEQLEGVNIVRNTMGGYNYRAFAKRNKYGKGTVISASYAKNDDPNAIALTQEVFPVIQQFLSQGYQTTQNQKQAISSFTFYDVHPPYYAVKRNTIGILFLGLCLLALGINELINKTTTANSDTFHKVLIIGGCLAAGLAFSIMAFTKVVFDTTNRVIIRSNPIGVGNRTFAFGNFVTFQITRRTTNLIYSGTDINMYFKIPGTEKQEPMVVKKFRSTKKIDLFLQETRQIMGIQ